METGIDIVQISRFEKNANDESFLKKYFASQEIEYIYSKHNALQTIAGLFCAKEAILKALGIGIGQGIKLCEINILHDLFGKPFVEITPQINYYLQQKNCSSISISISHDGDYAIAICNAI